jgi:hypothetical protein
MTKFPVAEAALIHTLWSLQQAWENHSPIFRERSLREHMQDVFDNPLDWEAFDAGHSGYRKLCDKAWSVQRGRWIRFRYTPRERWLHRLGLQLHDQWKL